MWLNAAGGGFFNADRTACALNTPEALKGLEFQANLYKAGKDVAVAYGEDPEPPFRAGKVAMFRGTDTFTTADGFRLQGWFVPATDARARICSSVMKLPSVKV